MVCDNELNNLLKKYNMTNLWHNKLWLGIDQTSFKFVKLNNLEAKPTAPDSKRKRHNGTLMKMSVVFFKRNRRGSLLNIIGNVLCVNQSIYTNLKTINQEY